MSVKWDRSLAQVISANVLRKRSARGTEMGGYTHKCAKTLCVEWITLGQ